MIAASPATPSSTFAFEAVRLAQNPIIRPGMDALMGANINGPSLIRVPEWVVAPLGKYYLYFAHHSGHYIRMAYADALTGPWTIFSEGTLQLRETPVVPWSYKGHIASPDVHVDHVARRIVMFFHGGYRLFRPRQATWVAESVDGLRFVSGKKRLGEPYWRRFSWNGHYFAIVMSGRLYTSDHPTSGYRPGPSLPLPGMRHPAVWVEKDRLHLFFSRVGDAPERILANTVELRDDWNAWRPSKEQTVLFPQEEYEGVRERVAPSAFGAAQTLVRQLRDPFVFEDDGELYLLYAVGGEHGIAIARLRKKPIKA
jgi:hypothetical protein